MGILDTASKVTVEFKADTSDLKKGIKDLVGEERKLAEAQLAQAEARNKQLDGWKDKLGTVTVALGATALAGKMLWDGYQLGAERAKLANASIGISIDALRKASSGLRSETELLRDAAASQGGAFKLTQTQLEQTERALVALNRKGIMPSEEAHKKLFDAVTELKTDGLGDFGIVVDKAGLSMENMGDRAILFERIMQKVATVGGAVKDGQLQAGEAMDAATIKLRDSWDQLRVGLGSIVVAFEPLISALAKVVGYVGTIVNAAQQGQDPDADPWDITAAGVIEGMSGVRTGAIRKRIQANAPGGPANPYDPRAIAQRKALEDVAAKHAEVLRVLANMNPNIEIETHNQGQLKPTWTEKELQEMAEMAADKALIGVRMAANATREALERFEKMRAQGGFGDNDLAFRFGVTGASKGGLGGAAEEDGSYLNLAARPQLTAELKAKIAAERARMTKNWNDRRANLQGQGSGSGAGSGVRGAQESQLAKMFGPIEEFNAYQQALQALGGAVSSSMDAWITGSMSAGEAFKKFIGEAVKGIAIQMAMESLKHGAFAIGSLAFGDVAGATTHGKAALAFGAGAALAAAAAKGMHSGASVPGAGAGGGARPSAPNTSTTGGGGRGSDQAPVIIVYGQDFVNSSARQRQLHARKMVKDAGLMGGDA